jgi:hypothetical protein
MLLFVSFPVAAREIAHACEEWLDPHALREIIGENYLHL